VKQAFLNGTRNFTKAQQRYIRYRLKKKLRLLDESRDAAAAQLLRLDTTVAQPGRGLPNIEKDIIKESLGRDSNPRPLPIGSRLFEPYLTKVTLYQAELPRQRNEQSSQ
jgi:hypothetical protein